MSFLITGPGIEFKAVTPAQASEYLFFYCSVQVAQKDIAALKKSGCFDFVGYGGYAVSWEDGRTLRDVEWAPNVPGR